MRKVTGSEDYQILPLANFDGSYEKLIKVHYQRDKKNREKFISTVSDFLKIIRKYPCDNRFSDSEGFPGKSNNSGLELRKKRWKKLPGLDGISKHGRLIFTVDKTNKKVYLMWIYTHKQFKKRPPEEDLRKQIEKIQELKTQTDNAT